MSWHAPSLPQHAPITIYHGGHDDKGIPHEHKCNRRDVKEIALMREHFNSDMSEAEWMRLCNQKCGFIYEKGKP